MTFAGAFGVHSACPEHQAEHSQAQHSSELHYALQELALRVAAHEHDAGARGQQRRAHQRAPTHAVDLAIVVPQSA